MFDRLFVFEAKFLPLKLHCTPTLMFTHMHFYNLNMLLIMGARSTKVETVLQVAFVLFLSPIDHCGGGYGLPECQP